MGGRVPWQEKIPAWYELRIHNNTTLVVAVHPKVCALLEVRTDLPIIRLYEERLCIPSFSLENGRWGFGGAMRLFSENNGWTSVHCPLPVYQTKEEEVFDKGNAKAVRASLSMLFTILSFYSDADGDFTVPQLIIIDNFDVLAGNALSAIVTPGMHLFLSNLKTGSLESVQQAMQIADRYMWQRSCMTDLLYSMQFRVDFSVSNKIHLSVPGNACGLDPYSYSNSSLGYRLGPHNVDSGTQQLTLLMGLARLCELGRAIYPECS